MTILKTSFGIIQKIKVDGNTTFVLPVNLTGTKLLNLKKKYKEFFADFKTIPLSKKEKAKNVFKVSYLPLTGITATIPQKEILFFAAVILSFIVWTVLMSYFKYKIDKNNEREPISFNDINQIF